MGGSGSVRRLALVFAIPIVIVAAVALQTCVPVEDLTVDPATRAGLPPWTGALSTAGILLWCAAGVCGIVAGSVRGHDARARCALAFGWLSAWLCIDDAFLVHDAVGPRYLGIPELAIVGAEALWLAALLVRHRLVLRREEPVVLLVALSCFCVSVISDAIPTRTHVPGLWRLASYAVEDGFKWVGICAFATWLVRLSRRTLPDAARGVTTAPR